MGRTSTRLAEESGRVGSSLETSTEGIMARTEEREQFLSDVVTIALEGGINYWADYRNYRNYQWGEGPTSVEIKDMECGMPSPWRNISHASIERGIKAIASGKVRFSAEIMGWILAGSALDDAGEIDATAADCIIQAAMFGEIVYG
jgi:hypothetical protein